MFEENDMRNDESVNVFDEDEKYGLVVLAITAAVGCVIGYGFGRAKGIWETTKMFLARR